MDPGDPTVLGVQRAGLIVGVVGIVMGIVRRREYNWPAVFASTSSGACCVLFAAPGLIELAAKVTTVGEGIAGLIFWASGMGGMLIVDFVLDALKNPWAAFMRWRQNGNPP